MKTVKDRVSADYRGTDDDNFGRNTGYRHASIRPRKIEKREIKNDTIQAVSRRLVQVNMRPQ